MANVSKTQLVGGLAAILGTILFMYNKEGQSSPEEKLHGLLVQYSDLKDPQSAQIRLSKVNTEHSQFCGELNAKNSFGGYTGWTRFYASITKTRSGEQDFYLYFDRNIPGIPAYALAIEQVSKFCRS